MKETAVRCITSARIKIVAKQKKFDKC
jgi:hypothetical protein